MSKQVRKSPPGYVPSQKFPSSSHVLPVPWGGLPLGNAPVQSIVDTQLQD
jgi:hypothetical protein